MWISVLFLNLHGLITKLFNEWWKILTAEESTSIISVNKFGEGIQLVPRLIWRTPGQFFIKIRSILLDNYVKNYKITMLEPFEC